MLARWGIALTAIVASLIGTPDAWGGDCGRDHRCWRHHCHHTCGCDSGRDDRSGPTNGGRAAPTGNLSYTLVEPAYFMPVYASAGLRLVASDAAPRSTSDECEKRLKNLEEQMAKVSEAVLHLKASVENQRDSLAVIKEQLAKQQKP